MQKFVLGIATLALAGGAASAAHAEFFDPARSSVTGAITTNDVSATDEGDGSWLGASVSGSTGHAFANGMTLDIDGLFEAYQAQQSDDPEEQPEALFMTTAHLNFAPVGLGPISDVRLGGFVAYGYSWTEDYSGSDVANYATVLIGTEAQAMVGDFHPFAQIGWGDVVEGEETDEEGFREGFFLRAGVDYFYTDTTLVSIEATGANTASFIDGGDNGEFYGLSLSGETPLPGTPFAIGAYYNYNHYEAAIGEEDTLNERILGISLTYRFGGASARAQAASGASLGVPMLPLYASAWAEQTD